MAKYRGSPKTRKSQNKKKEIQEEVETEATKENKVEQPVAEKEEEVDYTALLEKFEAKILAQVEAQYKEKEDAFKAEITALKKEVGSEIENEPTVNTKTKNSQSGNYLTNALRNRQSK